MALSPELSEILWWNFAYTLILTRCTPWDCQMTLEIGWVFVEVQILKKVRLLQNDIYRGCAERQILKNWKWPYLLNWVEYFDRLPRKHWYYQDLAQKIVKCHFSSDEVLPRSKFWKSENPPISWTEWNTVMKFCIHIGILTRYSPWDCQMTFGIGRGFAKVQILKKKVKITSKTVDKILQTIWCWKDLGQGIAKWHLLSVEALPSAKFWKGESGSISWTEWNILINFCVNIDIDKI